LLKSFLNFETGADSMKLEFLNAGFGDLLVSVVQFSAKVPAASETFGSH